jgi:uncharacterized protein (DUF736 family)
MRTKLLPPLTLALVSLLMLFPGAASNAAPIAWGEPITIFTGARASAPQLVTNGTTITAAWTIGSERNELIQASSSADGGSTWSVPVDPTGATAGAFGPLLVTRGTTTTVTWIRYDENGAPQVQASSFTDGGTTWSTPVDISDASQNASEPQLVTHGTTITATWITNATDASQRIQTSSSANGGTEWSAPVTLSPVGREASNPQLFANGTAVTATWTDGESQRIQASSFTGVGTIGWSDPVNLFDDGRDANRLQLATSGTTITATWIRSDDNGNEIVQASSSTDGGTTWGTTVNLSTGFSASGLQLVTDGTTITATWRSSGRIQASSSTNGGTNWSTTVNLPTDGDASGPQLVTDGTTITAIWSSSEEDDDDNSIGRIQASSSTNGGTNWSTTVNLFAANQDAPEPQLVTDGTTITAIWRSFDEEGNTLVQVSSFTAAAATPDSPEPVATPDASELIATPAKPELAATGLGDQTTTLGVLALILMLGGITILGSRTMMQQRAQRMSRRS